MAHVCVSEPGRSHALTAQPVAIRWHEDLPIFAREECLSAVGDEYGWLGGLDEAGQLRCILPYTVVRKVRVRMVRFRTATIQCGKGLDVHEEKSFLNGVVEHFRRGRADVIIPPTNNAIFRTYPDRADAAPYGSYVIDLQQPEERLWRNIGKITRQNISTAKKDGVSVREGIDFLDTAHELTRETFRRSAMPFMGRDAFRRFAIGLGEHGKLLRAEYEGAVHSCCLFGFSKACAYAIYAGNAPKQHQGAIKLLLWEAMRLFRDMGVRRFDFYGARVNPEKGSKQEALNLMKKRLGGTLSEGYMWKCRLRPWRGWAYSVGVRLLRGGDIVDQERHKFRDGRSGEEGEGKPAAAGAPAVETTEDVRCAGGSQRD